MEATYIDHMGTDLTVVNAARVSFRKQSEWLSNPPTYLDTTETVIQMMSPRDAKLIKYLADHQHWTPFAHPQVTLHMKAPIFVRTQCFKHKVGFTENEVSRRYVDDEPEFYTPETWRKRAENKKQGSGTGKAYTIELNDVLMTITGLVDGLNEKVLEIYNALIETGVAPEQARMILPQSMYTEWYWTGSLAAWARFVKQRTHEGAQEETKQLAEQCAEIIQPLFPVSWKALTT